MLRRRDDQKEHARNREHSNFLARWIRTLKLYPSATWGVVVALTGLAISLTTLYQSAGPELSLTLLVRTASLTGVGLILSFLLLTLVMIDIAQREVERNVSSRVDQIEEQMRAASPVELVNHPDDIWTISARMLHEISPLRHNPHAYDVSSYMNRIKYEEAVADVVERGISFARVFCLQSSAKTESEEALEWFFEQVSSGGVVVVDSLRNQKGLELEIRRSFKENYYEDIPDTVSTEMLERINRVISTQHEAKAQGLLTITTIDHPLHMDFVGTYFEEDATAMGAAGSVPTRCEVMANFKTDPAGETYVAGTHATGILALRYREFFLRVLSL